MDNFYNNISNNILERLRLEFNYLSISISLEDENLLYERDSSSQIGVSILELAKILGLENSLDIIRTDIINLTNPDNMYGHLTLELSDQSDEELDEEFQVDVCDNNFENFKKGKYDSLKLYLYSASHDSLIDEINIALSPTEHHILNLFVGYAMREDTHLKILSPESNYCYIKNSYYDSPYTSKEFEITSFINTCINHNDTITIKYGSESREITLLPLHIIHYNYNHNTYLVTIDNGNITPYLINKIHEVNVSKKPIIINDLAPLENLPHIWGMEISQKIHVKIRIEKISNVVEKAKRDLSFHNKGIYTENENYVFFEDDVIGVDHFRSWVRSYGSSIIVLEPISLAKTMLESAINQLKNY